jgi:lambda repressor-like predicted transcriptional regulator
VLSLKKRRRARKDGPSRDVHLREVLSNFTKATRHLIDARESAPPGPVELAVEPGVRVLRQPNRRLQPSEVDELVIRYQAGATMSGLAKDFGMHFQTVRAHLRRNGVSLRSEQPALTSDDIAEAVALYQQGWSTYRLGERFQVDRSTVGKALRRAGVALRSSAGARSFSWQAPDRH